MKILITGGTGYIGRPVVKHLIDVGHELIVYTRSPTKARAIFSHNAIRFIQSFDEIADDETIDSIINYSGEPILFKRWTKSRKQILEASRIGVTNKLVELIRRLDRKPEVLISGSAVGYYGNRGDHKLSEAAEPHDEYSHRLCAAWEGAALRAKAYDVRVCILRTGVVIGRNGGFMAGMLPSFKLGLGARIGDGQQWLSWVHEKDLQRMIYQLLDNKSLNGIFNATAPLPVTNQYFTNLLAKVLKRPSFLWVPAFVLEKLLGENSQVLLGGQRVIPKAWEAAGFEFQYPNLQSALESVV